MSPLNGREIENNVLSSHTLFSGFMVSWMSVDKGSLRPNFSSSSVLFETASDNSSPHKDCKMDTCTEYLHQWFVETPKSQEEKKEKKTGNF